MLKVIYLSHKAQGYHFWFVVK